MLASYGMVMAIDSETDVPVYQQLAAILRTQIDSGEIKPHRAIPSKRVLSQDYHVSPGTVERAIQALRAEGYLKTVLGRGLFVRPPEERSPR
ncbi:MAG TPA: winged helix-turn-helix domain-containing protein [Streptosporangiaceae bacterium]|nr:winged helix-turn-helix domain-containing protein [Streptosporangiaceae bacterium]